MVAQNGVCGRHGTEIVRCKSPYRVFVEPKVKKRTRQLTNSTDESDFNLAGSDKGDEAAAFILELRDAKVKLIEHFENTLRVDRILAWISGVEHIPITKISRGNSKAVHGLQIEIQK